MTASHPFGWSGWCSGRCCFFTSPSTEDRSRAEEASKDVKSDRDGKSAVPGPPPEASCSGLILCESMCRGPGLCHTSSSTGINSLALALSSPLHPLMFPPEVGTRVSLGYGVWGRGRHKETRRKTDINIWYHSRVKSDTSYNDTRDYISFTWCILVSYLASQGCANREKDEMTTCRCREAP